MNSAKINSPNFYLARISGASLPAVTNRLILALATNNHGKLIKLIEFDCQFLAAKIRFRDSLKFGCWLSAGLALITVSAVSTGAIAQTANIPTARYRRYPPSGSS